MELANLRRGHGGTKHRGDEWSIKTLGALLFEVVADALDMSLSRGVNDLLALQARYDAVFNQHFIPDGVLGATTTTVRWQGVYNWLLGTRCRGRRRRGRERAHRRRAGVAAGEASVGR
ncbi:hypothetical protein JG687_00018033 [Phytophthora cactorum]|uniref:Uncharacterized protein n=1 Tax=Phytophthora cactorum TaxID=29920 RepID=A0A8T1TQU6_9STRA|nr:hypothetical protein JG687_00018033 [Phytophthora cactorum]